MSLPQQDISNTKWHSYSTIGTSVTIAMYIICMSHHHQIPPTPIRSWKKLIIVSINKTTSCTVYTCSYCLLTSFSFLTTEVIMKTSSDDKNPVTIIKLLVLSLIALHSISCWSAKFNITFLHACIETLTTKYRFFKFHSNTYNSGKISSGIVLIILSFNSLGK